MATELYLEFVFTTVDDDGSNLLIHEDKNGGQKGRSQGARYGPPGVGERIDKPSSSFPRRFELGRNDQLRGMDTGPGIDASHRADGDENTKVTDGLPHLKSFFL